MAPLSLIVQEARAWSERIIFQFASQVSWIFSNNNIIHMSICEVMTQYIHHNPIPLENVIRYYPLMQVNTSGPSDLFCISVIKSTIVVVKITLIDYARGSRGSRVSL